MIRMKKHFLLFLVLLVFAARQLSATSQDKAELLKALDERQILFARYSSSLSKHSGFFGSRTKNDLKESQTYLKQIIEADNKIIATLQRTLDFRDFEKLNQTYNTRDNEDRISNLLVVNDSLLHKVNQLEKENKTFKRNSGEGKLMQLILFIGLLAALYIIYKNKRKNIA